MINTFHTSGFFLALGLTASVGCGASNPVTPAVDHSNPLADTAEEAQQPQNEPKADERPGDTQLPSSDDELKALAALETGSYQYSVADYFSNSHVSDFQFSPDGKHVSYRQKDALGKRHLYIKTGDKVTRVLEETTELIRGYFWANNEQLGFVKDKGGDENYHLYVVNLDGTSPRDLTPFPKVKVRMLALLREFPDEVIVAMNKDNPKVFAPYRIHLKTGGLVKLYDNADTENPINSYDFDKEGKLRAYTKMRNGTESVLYYRSGENEPFKTIVEATWKDTFSILAFNEASPYPHDAYVGTNLQSDKQQIVVYDLARNKPIRTVIKDATYDVGGIFMSRKRKYEVDYYSYNSERREVVPVSKTYKRLHKKFRKRFGAYDVSVASRTDDESKYLLLVDSDRYFGAYYIYDVAKDTYEQVAELLPQLKEQDMVEMKPIQYQARDGLTIHGYLSLPKQAKPGTKVPLIVHPHGGPYGPRDHWGFNRTVQLFASRGYATLQINYRGSGGYGKKFSMAGNKQIGRKMLDDLEDGVAYVSTLGAIDSTKIAIFGASYGGLATLGSLVKTPDMYACGVDYVGVSNLFTFFESFPPYWKPYLAQVYEQWYDANDPVDQEIMKAVSPALHTDKIKKPLFVIQGANDPRVNINESDQIVRNIRDRGIEVPYMVRYDEGHGFGHEENRIQMNQAMMGFLAQCLK